MPVFRPITTADQTEVLDLWDACFGPERDYFVRYFAADPWYRPGDCVGAWLEGRLVSAAHVCRRPLQARDGALLCGAIANVATLPGFRRRGLSREILTILIRRMEAEGFHFSMLFTGTYHHYAPLGWEQTFIPQVTLKLAACPAGGDPGPWPSAGLARVARCYQALPPRPLRVERPALYAGGWVGWNWAGWGATVLGSEEVGFVVVAPPGESGKPFRVLEWHARDATAEGAVLAQAARWAWERGGRELSLAGLPAYGAASIERLGGLEHNTRPHMMLRNVGLPPAEFEEVQRLYRTGESVWWPSEAF